MQRKRDRQTKSLPSLADVVNESSMRSLALSVCMWLDPHTCLFAVREALAAADMVFFHGESRVVMIAWYASVCTCSLKTETFLLVMQSPKFIIL